MNVQNVIDALLQTQWALGRMDGESPEWQKVLDARDKLAEVITDYTARLEKECKNTQAK